MVDRDGEGPVGAGSVGESTGAVEGRRGQVPLGADDVGELGKENLVNSGKLMAIQHRARIMF